jgi:hypothetical protein
MSFKDFMRSARVTNSPRGDFIADAKTLINAGAFPAVENWADLYGFMSRRGSSADKIEEARKLWREYKSKVTAPESAGEAA